MIDARILSSTNDSFHFGRLCWMVFVFLEKNSVQRGAIVDVLAIIRVVSIRV